MDNQFQVLLQAVLDSSNIGQQDITKVQKVIDKYHINLATELDTASMLAEIKKVVPQLEAELSKIYKTKIEIDDASILKAIKQIGSEAEKTASKIKNITTTLNSGSYGVQIEKLKSDFQKFGLSADEAENKVKELRATLSTMESSSGNKLVSDYQNFQNQLKGVKVQLDQTKLSFDKFAQPASSEKVTSLLLKIQNFMSKNTAITKEAKAELQSYINELSGGTVSVSRLNQINQSLAQTETQMRSLGRLGKSLKDQMAQAAESFTQWISVSSAVMLGVSKTKDAISELKDVDDIITEISKTSDMTSEQLQKLASTSFGKASNLGRTATDYLSGVEEMARSGYYGDQGEAMAQQSLLAQAAGDMTAELANKYVLATNAAYKFQGDAEKLNEVLDGQNMVSNRNSVAMEDMAEGMSEAGTVASSYRVSIEDLTAMIGTMEAVTKSGGNEVGNSLKSILINLQNVTSSKITSTLDKANASMTEFVNGTEQLRNPMDILRDLAKTFNELDESDPMRAEILTNVGGKYQASKLAALLQNVDMMDKMLKDYSEGSGSAMSEAAKSVDSLSGRLNTLSNTWTSTVNNIVNSDALKWIVSGLSGALSAVNSFTSALGSLGTITFGAGLTVFIKNFD